MIKTLKELDQSLKKLVIKTDQNLAITTFCTGCSWASWASRLSANILNLVLHKALTQCDPSGGATIATNAVVMTDTTQHNCWNNFIPLLSLCLLISFFRLYKGKLGRLIQSYSARNVYNHACIRSQTFPTSFKILHPVSVGYIFHSSQLQYHTQFKQSTSDWLTYGFL